MATERRMARKSSQQEEEEVALTLPHIDFSEGKIVLVKLIRSTAVGATIGSIFGTGAGLVKRKGLEGSLTEGRSIAKAFAILFGVHSYVSQSMKRLRGKDDAINAGVAGCIAGLAVIGPGSSLVRSCLTYGTFSSIFEGVRKDPDSLVRLSKLLKEPKNIPQKILQQMPVLPPFTLPFPFSKDPNQSKKPTSRRKSKRKK